MKKRFEVEQRDSETAFGLRARCSGTGLQRLSAVCLEKFQGLKERVSRELASRFATLRPEFLRQAVNEAAALAADTAFPTLFLPTLAEEKVFLASQWQRKQQAIQEQQTWFLAA